MNTHYDAEAYKPIITNRPRARLVQFSSPSLAAWITKLGWSEPVEVPCGPVKGMAEGRCFDNVERQVSKLGGAVVYGHMFVETPGFAVQSESHAVWRRPDGELLDITEYQSKPLSVLFVADHSVERTRANAISAYLMLTKDPRITAVLAFEHAIEDWLKAQMPSLESLQRAMQGGRTQLRPDYGVLQADIMLCGLPRKVIGVLLTVKLGAFIGLLPKDSVPEDVRGLMRIR